MSKDFAGFCDVSYQTDNRYAAVERTVNFYCEANETQSETKYKIQLLPSPGNAAFCVLPLVAPFNQPTRGMIEYRGQVFGVNGNCIFNIDQTGAFTNLLAPIPNDGKPVSMVGNGNDQIFLCSAGYGFVINVNYGSISTVTGIGFGDFLGASMATFQDGYIVVTTPNSNQFQISGDDTTPIGDARVWSAANISVQAGQADPLMALISSREYLRLLGSRRSQIYQNVGAAGIGGFPFQSYNETFIETGIGAPFSLVELGDSLLWIGEDARGQRACWRDFAFQPQRASNFAVEQFWQQYPTIADAVAFPFIWMGHQMVQISFPTADKTWVYDATMSVLLKRAVWTERTYTDFNGNAHARSEQFHCFAWGKHLVGSVGIDGNPGAIYQYSPTQFADCGVDFGGNQAQMAMVRDRICPHLWSGNKRIVYNRIEFELARGTATNTGQGANPVIMLRWSNDGGQTFGPEHQIPVGQIGQFARRVYFNRCGYARDRVFFVRCSDPIFWGFVAAELDFLVLGS